MRAVVVATLAALALLAAAAGAQAAGSQATLIAANCNPVWVSGQAMIYNARNSAGLWDAYAGTTDCHGTPLLAAYSGHRAATSVSADGRYVLLEVDTGSPLGQAQAEPGKGVGNEIELLDRQTGALTQLTSDRPATIWAQFTHPDGSQISWSQMTENSWQTGDVWNNLLGWWQMHVGDIAGGQLANERTYANPNGNGFTETYGEIGPNLLLFASDAGVQPPSSFAHWLSSQLWTVPDTLDQPPTRLTPTFTAWWGGRESDYAEFGAAINGWIYTSIARQAIGGGMDVWRLHPDGSNIERVTWFGGTPSGWGTYAQVAGYPPPAYVVVGRLVIDPNDPNTIYAGVASDPNAKTVNAWQISVG